MNTKKYEVGKRSNSKTSRRSKSSKRHSPQSPKKTQNLLLKATAKSKTSRANPKALKQAQELKAKIEAARGVGAQGSPAGQT